jgi:hypothetical protein
MAQGTITGMATAEQHVRRHEPAISWRRARCMNINPGVKKVHMHKRAVMACAMAAAAENRICAWRAKMPNREQKAKRRANEQTLHQRIQRTNDEEMIHAGNINQYVYMETRECERRRNTMAKSSEVK